jgi:valyl-tRNA synthetase
MMNLEGKDCGLDESLPLEFSFADKWIISRLQQAEAAINQALQTYRFDLAAQAIYEFAWDEYCDWYVELAKVQLQGGNEAAQRATRRTLVRVLETTLRLAHPIIPFITEELWQIVAPMAGAKHTDSIMIAEYPQADESKIDATALAQFEQLKEIVYGARNLRGEMNLSPAVRAPLFVEGGNAELQGFAPYIQLLAKLSEVNLVATLPADDAPVAVVGNMRLMLKVEIDKGAETARLNKEITKTEAELLKVTTKLEKPGYTDKAPAHLVEKDRAQIADLTQKLQRCREQLAKLG